MGQSMYSSFPEFVGSLVLLSSSSVACGISLRLQAPQTCMAEDSVLMALLRNMISWVPLFVFAGEFNPSEIDWLDKRSPRNITGDEFLTRLHTHGLNEHAKQTTIFRDGQQPSTPDPVIAKDGNEICCAVMEELSRKRGNSVLQVTLDARHA